MRQSLKAAIAYFGLVFLAGSLLGTVRELLISPLVGPDQAVVLEVPFMMFASFIAARWTLMRLEISARMADRVFVGAAAFLLLLVAEEILTQVTRGQSVFTHWAGFGLVASLANVAGLSIYFAMPLMVVRHQVFRRQS